MARCVCYGMFGWLLVGVLTGFAADTNLWVMDEITVTPGRGEAQAWEAPVYFDQRNADDLRLQRAARTMPEALDGLPGVMVQKTSHGQGSPYLRGFTGFRTLFLIDGVRLNNATFRDGPNQYWNTVDPLGVSRLEVVRGPFSVLYGSDAIGGTVQALTRGSADLDPDEVWQRRTYYRYASAERSHIFRGEAIGRPVPDWTMSAGWSVKEFGNVKGGRDVGTQPKTGYREQDWDAKLEWQPDADSRLVLMHQGVVQDDVWRTHRTLYGIDWEGLTTGDELRRVFDHERRLTYIQGVRKHMSGPVESIHAGVSHQLQQEERDRLRSRDRHDRQGVEVHSLGAFVHLESPAGGSGRFAYGIEAYRDFVESFAYTLNPDGTVADRRVQGPVGDDAVYDTVGAYLQHELMLTRRWTLTTGGRLEHARAAVDVMEDVDTGMPVALRDDWQAVAGSMRALYRLDDAGRYRLFGGVSQGFRAPNLSDLTRLDTARTDEIETPSPDLEPEQFVSYEIGVKTASRNFRVQAGYYYTDIRNMIVRTPTGRVMDGNNEVTKQNAGDGYVQGVELEGQWLFQPNWLLRASFGWLDGKVETYPTSDLVGVDEPLDRLMPATAQFALKHDTRYGWVEVAVTGAAKADTLSSRDKADSSRIPAGGTPGYTIVDLRSGWRLVPGLAVTVSVENVLDEDYRIHGSGVNEPGRNLVLAAEYVF